MPWVLHDKGTIADVGDDGRVLPPSQGRSFLGLASSTKALSSGFSKKQCSVAADCYRIQYMQTPSQGLRKVILGKLEPVRTSAYLRTACSWLLPSPVLGRSGALVCLGAVGSAESLGASGLLRGAQASQGQLLVCV